MEVLKVYTYKGIIIEKFKSAAGTVFYKTKGMHFFTIKQAKNCIDFYTK